MPESITQEKRKEYTLLKENFHKKRDEAKNKIEGHNSIIQKRQEEISNLEKELNNSRPLIEGCDSRFECSNCEVYSMKFLGIQPGQGERFHHYECVICGHQDYQT